MRKILFFSTILSGLIFIHPVMASNACFYVDGIVDHGTYMTVQWHTGTLSNCPGGGADGFVFATNTSTHAPVNTGNPGIHTESALSRDGTANENGYPSVTWGTSGGACNINIFPKSGYADNTAYSTDVWKLYDTTTGNDYAYNLTQGNSVYIHLLSAAVCAQTSDAVYDPNPYVIAGNPSVSSSGTTVAGRQITQFFQATTTRASIIEYQEQNPNGIFLQLPPTGGKWVYQTGQNDGDTVIIQNSFVQYVDLNGTYSFSYRLIDKYHRNVIYQSATSTYVTSGINPAYQNSYIIASSTVGMGMVIASSTIDQLVARTGLQYATTTASFWQWEFWTTALYNAGVKIFAIIVVPPDYSLSSFQDSLNALKTRFPMNIFFDFTATVQNQTGYQSGTTVSAPQLGGFTPSVSLIASSTLANVFGTANTDSYFIFLQNLIWVGLGFKIFTTII